MKRIIFVLALYSIGLHAAEVVQEAAVTTTSEPVQDSAAFLNQIKQIIGAKASSEEVVRPVVDPTLEAQALNDLQEPAVEEDSIMPEELADDDSHDQPEEELSGEEMSGYFADVGADMIDDGM